MKTIDADTGVFRVGLVSANRRYFRVDPRNWLNLQVAFDLWKLEQDSGRQLNHEVKPLVAA